MPSKIFTKYLDVIKGYCTDNGLIFDKLLKSSYCYGKDDLIFLYHDPEKGKMGLLDDTPSPATLEIYLENGKLRFVQTDITHKYLGVDREAGPAAARVFANSPHPPSPEWERAAPRTRRGELAHAI